VQPVQSFFLAKRAYDSMSIGQFHDNLQPNCRRVPQGILLNIEANRQKSLIDLARRDYAFIYTKAIQ
jgi:hypothetical protein